MALHLSRTPTTNLTTTENAAQHDHDGGKNTHQDIYDAAIRAAREQRDTALRIAQDRYKAAVRAARELLLQLSPADDVVRFAGNGTSAH